MAVTVTKVDVWAADIDDTPGALDRVLEAIANAGGDLECVIGRRRHDQPGKGQVFVSPIKGKKVQDAARSVGLAPAADMVTLRIETSNKPGTGHLVMHAVAEAGVNVRGISAIARGNTTVAYVGLDSKEAADKAVKAIKKAAS